MRWMKLEPIIQSEVSQKEKHQKKKKRKKERKTRIQYINAYIWNLERWQRWPYMWDSKRDIYVKNRLLDSVGEGEGGMIWENSIETCILPYVNYIASPGSMHETGCSGLVHWDDPEGWDGEGGGRGVQDGEHMYTYGWVMSMYGKNMHTLQYCKVISLQLE